MGSPRGPVVTAPPLLPDGSPDREALAALVGSMPSVAAIASAVGVVPSTVYRWLAACELQPPTRARGPLTASLNVPLTVELRADLEAEAARTGQPITEVARRRLAAPWVRE